MNQAFRACSLSGYFTQKSFNVFLEMILKIVIYANIQKVPELGINSLSFNQITNQSFYFILLSFLISLIREIRSFTQSKAKAIAYLTEYSFFRMRLTITFFSDWRPITRIPSTPITGKPFKPDHHPPRLPDYHSNLITPQTWLPITFS